MSLDLVVMAEVTACPGWSLPRRTVWTPRAEVARMPMPTVGSQVNFHVPGDDWWRKVWVVYEWDGRRLAAHDVFKGTVRHGDTVTLTTVEAPVPWGKVAGPTSTARRRGQA